MHTQKQVTDMTISGCTDFFSPFGIVMYRGVTWASLWFYKIGFIDIYVQHTHMHREISNEINAFLQTLLDLIFFLNLAQ